ncbi:MAG: galactose mutarotase [Muribaculaceae bacterium]|nr:galactose mutarotase [Muribaculaceae bacterium]
MISETHNYPAPFGEITLVRLVNDHGAAITLSSLGAGIIAVEVPDRLGKISNIALSYENPADYMADPPTMGKTAGRYANRIVEGALNVDGKDYKLDCNCGPHHLHGGPTGFQNQLWQTELLPNGVRFSLISPDLHENYPGTIRATVEYRWNNLNELSISFEATSDAPTVINLTNHTYWNLDGADSGNALHHQLKLKASRWLPTDDTLAPTGELESVIGTPMDFLDFHTVGERIREDFPALKFGKGYDNCWAIDGATEAALEGRKEMIEDAAVLKSDVSGRVLHVDTDQPGVQVYSGNWLDGSPKNTGGRSYNDYDGIAIEAQGFPDAPNIPSFPSQRLDPQHPYSRTIIYRFTTE